MGSNQSYRTNSILIYCIPTDRCILAVQAHLLNPTNKKSRVANNLCNYLHEVSELLPEVSFIDCDLALHCLTTRFHNMFCLYHHTHDKAGNVNDVDPPSFHRVTGVPWARDAKSRDPKEKPIVREPKVLHCGCYADDALWDFFWWKTGFIHSPTTDRTESWRFTRLEPRARGLMVQFVRDFTHLEIDDIFSGTMDTQKTMLRIFRQMQDNLEDACTELENDIQTNSLLV